MTSTAAEAVGFYGYLLSTPFGFVGHICSIITFSSQTLRSTSTGLVFMTLTLSDMLYLFISIRDFVSVTLNLPSIRSEHLCRFREFASNFAAFTSSWLLVLISIDRLICTHFPYRTAKICTRKVAGCSIVAVSICSAAFTSHVLQPAVSYANPSSNWCGPPAFPSTDYSIFYYNTWTILRLMILYIVPSCFMIVCLVSVHLKIHRRPTIIVPSVRRERVQRQMLILMISTVIWFCVSTLPYSVYQIFYLKFGDVSVLPIEIFVFYNALNMNYCYNFYIHCLTSQLFRQNFIQKLKQLYLWLKRKTRRQVANQIYPMITNIQPTI
ncbi:unnamed protein product [Adineta ricciae]|uniref:G-protein coupled receptors family 1 profile domain-containing protein n=1 Tax=Adineta ricciae TaxID=249248 RepID=A0A815E9B6_ADIRI|nr:unnamed protein product [Adineta ricciae]CAF1311857.1 unnamed protein product [Adineta ricciae]